jgi:hypothetical protein
MSAKEVKFSRMSTPRSIFSLADLANQGSEPATQALQGISTRAVRQTRARSVKGP